MAERLDLKLADELVESLAADWAKTLAVEMAGPRAELLAAESAAMREAYWECQ